MASEYLTTICVKQCCHSEVWLTRQRVVHDSICSSSGKVKASQNGEIQNRVPYGSVPLHLSCFEDAVCDIKYPSQMARSTYPILGKIRMIVCSITSSFWIFSDISLLYAQSLRCLVFSFYIRGQGTCCFQASLLVTVIWQSALDGHPHTTSETF